MYRGAGDIFIFDGCVISISGMSKKKGEELAQRVNYDKCKLKIEHGEEVVNEEVVEEEVVED